MRPSSELSGFEEAELTRFEKTTDREESNFGVKNDELGIDEDEVGFRRNFKKLEIVVRVSERTQKAILTNETNVWPFNRFSILLSLKLK